MHTTITMPGAVIGYRRDGRPIRLQAGGSEGAPEQPPTGEGGQPPENPPAEQPQAAPPAREETDWKAMARQWERRAKENSKAADDLAKLKQQSMSDQEKAVEQARVEGRTEAAREHGKQLAEAQFDAALARKGLDLGDAADLIDKSRFVNDDGTVDKDAIAKAVAKLAKLTPKTPSSSGGDFGGGNGQGAPPKNLREQIREAEQAGDWKLSRQLKSQLALSQTTQ
ncbi:hypothetical protein FXF51_56805 [Nonomuraea sp. PA05]|uniref:hypothetical protein n=1 Tax=Nonomuraea sp. PA05 TaxID=2604466 RepID=UPI0011DA8CC6|nr:hypothetical protein [Nonomuraea sp. PA05]TYB50243.1 hypothetical protein FXF51_56805 [Nonomuraea sp. PA05]